MNALYKEFEKIENWNTAFENIHSFNDAEVIDDETLSKMIKLFHSLNKGKISEEEFEYLKEKYIDAKENYEWRIGGLNEQIAMIERIKKGLNPYG